MYRPVHIVSIWSLGLHLCAISCTLLLPIVLSDRQFSVRFSPSEDVSSKSYYIEYVDRLVSCVYRCTGLKGCVTVSYNKASRLCHFYSTVLDPERKERSILLYGSMVYVDRRENGLPGIVRSATSSLTATSSLSSPSRSSHMDQKSFSNHLIFSTMLSQSSPPTEPKVSTLSTEAKVSPLSTEPKVSPVSSESKVSPLSTEPKVSPVSSESKVSPLSTEPKVSLLSSESDVVPSYTKPKRYPSSTEPNVSPPSTEPKVSLSSTEPKVSPSSTEAKVFPSTTEAKVFPSSTETIARPLNLSLRSSNSTNPRRTLTLFKDRVTFRDAELLCIGINQSLLAINSPDMQAKAVEKAKTSGLETIVIGLYMQSFHWVYLDKDLTRVKYTAWAPGQPLGFHAAMSKTYDYLWIGLITRADGYICERDT